MYTISRLVALAAAFSSASAVYQGFNYGSTFTNGAPKQQSDFEAEFRTAGSLDGAPAAGFHSARLYTTVQAGTVNDPISAIPAAIKTKTSLLLGIWASAGEAVFANELHALKAAIEAHKSDLAGLVAGISVGSEDLYRISPTGLLNNENPGASPATIADYIKRVREAIKDTPLARAPIGHVDTWTAWVNGSNNAVIEACDWIGFDAYPYFQATNDNNIANSRSLFDEALHVTIAAVGDKPVWITETGFPVSGKTVGHAVPGLQNARAYWNDVGCAYFGTANVWWYTFQDSAPDTPNPSFGVIGSDLTTTPLYNLECKKDASVKPPPPILPPSAPEPSAPEPSASEPSNSEPSSTPGGESGSSTKDSASSSASAPAIDNGSPGAGNALPSSQVSLETSAVPSSAATPSETSSAGSGSESGSDSTASGGTDAPTPFPSEPATDSNAAGSLSLSSPIGAIIAVAMAVFLAV